jgi:septum formation topological specificity factor MinE
MRREGNSMQNMVIPKEQFEKNSEEIRAKITAWVSETFNVDRNKVKVEFEEREGHVIIITNVSFH